MTPIFVALDTQDVHRAAAIARDIGGLAAGLKLGLEFFCANGEDGVLRIAEHETPVFLDLKFHDIPNTVEGAVQAIAHLDPAILTVHAAGGRAMMRAAKAAAPPRTKVVAVTVLTSLDRRRPIEHRDRQRTGKSGGAPCSACSRVWARRDRLLGRRDCAGTRGVARWLLRCPGSAARGFAAWRSETDRHSASSHRRRRVGAGHRTARSRRR